ncbi:CLUMA_CG012247, isoform A [Clunio marinus]|uniref:CLUMA_CG012247, isoform A n=1 Tax=Clunio marinus TaxID=568069 RepID=A0A1J1IFK8_9DIPT|nr:CLUMA_CG012247, isoform A [Clunio marinus]
MRVERNERKVEFGGGTELRERIVSHHGIEMKLFLRSVRQVALKYSFEGNKESWQHRKIYAQRAIESHLELICTSNDSCCIYPFGDKRKASFHSPYAPQKFLRSASLACNNHQFEILKKKEENQESSLRKALKA